MTLVNHIPSHASVAHVCKMGIIKPVQGASRELMFRNIHFEPVPTNEHNLYSSLALFTLFKGSRTGVLHHEDKQQLHKRAIAQSPKPLAHTVARCVQCQQVQFYTTTDSRLLWSIHRDKQEPESLCLPVSELTPKLPAHSPSSPQLPRALLRVSLASWETL